MHYDIQLGFLAADAISEFSRATATKEAAHYEAFLQQSSAYCQRFRNVFASPVDADVAATMPGLVAEFMRAVVKTQQPSPTVSIKMTAVGEIEKLVEAIRNQRRHPSDDECLRIAKTIYSTSAAEPR